MIVLGVVIGLVVGFAAGWFVYTKKLVQIEAEVVSAENWATGETRLLIDRVKEHL